MSRTAEAWAEEQQAQEEFAQVKAGWTNADLEETRRRIREAQAALRTYRIFGVQADLLAAMNWLDWAIDLGPIPEEKAQ